VEFKQDGTVAVSASMMTGCPGVFAGGDMVPAERTVTVGTGHGKKAAGFIDAFLRGEELERPAKHATLLSEFAAWMARKGFHTLNDLRGKLSPGRSCRGGPRAG
jgi:hypothetical protein